MWCILIFMCFFLANLDLSLLITTNKFPNYHNDTSNCSSQSINIDTSKNKLDQRQDYISMVITSSWKQILVKTDNNKSEEANDHATILNNVQIIFDIPYPISNGSILNQTIFIIDTIHNQLTHMCINGSSFIINYSTNKPFPHNVCLYLLLNITSSVYLKEIFICRIINKKFSSDNNQISDDNFLGPSIIFLVEQGMVSLFIMLIICMIHATRNKRVFHRIAQDLFHNQLVPRTSNIDTTNEIYLNNFITLPMAEQVLSTANLIAIPFK